MTGVKHQSSNSIEEQKRQSIPEDQKLLGPGSPQNFNYKSGMFGQSQ